MVAEAIVLPARVGSSSMNADHSHRLSLLNRRSSTASVLAQNVAEATRRRIAALSAGQDSSSLLGVDTEEATRQLLSAAATPRHTQEAAETALRLAVVRNSLSRPNAAAALPSSPSLARGTSDLARALAATSSPLAAAAATRSSGNGFSPAAELLLLRSLASSATAQNAAAAAAAASPALRAQKEALLRQLDLLDRAEAQATQEAIIRARLEAALSSRAAAAAGLPGAATTTAASSTTSTAAPTPNSPSAASLKPPSVPSSSSVQPPLPKKATSTAAEVEQILASSAMRNNASKQILLEDHELREATDVLCGRGGKSNHWQGNKRYRQVISDMRRKYRGIHTKTDKTSLSRAIVDYVNSYGGRFLKKDHGSGKYFEMSKGEARKKTAQALRETKELKWTM